MSVKGILQITDGTETGTIDLRTGGFRLVNWTPVTAQPKGGGVWNDSMLDDNRRPVMFKRGNATELFNLKVVTRSQDDTIRETQELRRLLEKAKEFWTTEWQNEPVWLVARGPCETNERYAIIVNYRAERDDDPYQSPFGGTVMATMDQFDLQIERMDWLSNPPGEGDCVEITNIQDGEGRAATCTNEVYIANKHNEAQITDVWYYDASAAAYTGNLFGGALPYALYPAVPAVDDILYIGIDVAGADTGPFASAIFDITAAVDITTVQWQYWNGAAWALIASSESELDDPAGGFFNLAGVGSFSFVPPNVWATNSPGGALPVGYWIRAYIQAIGAAPTAPTQQNRDIYTAIRPSVDIDEQQITGDITALARAYSYLKGGTQSSSIIMATRSAARGSDFRMYINIADEQNAAGISVTPDGVNAVLADYVESPTGRAVRYNPGAGLTGTVNIVLDDTIIGDYVGKYRCYLRVDRESAVTDCTITLSIIPSTYSYSLHTSETLTVDSDLEAYLMDFGIIDLPGLGIIRDNDTIGDITIRLSLANVSANPDVYLYDLILIPIDEWAGEFISQDLDLDYLDYIDYQAYTYLDIDSLNQKRPLVALKREDDGNISSIWKDITSEPLQLQANTDQQLFCMMKEYDNGTSKYAAPVTGLFTIQLFQTSRYLSMRGDR